jgi:hypothetical protein
MSNVVPIAAGADVQTSALDTFPAPRHFKRKALKETWKDLVETTDAALHVKQHRFTFEMAATLLAKFRAGETMTATESKELKKLLITLGLAQAEDDGRGKSKPRKNAHYFE